MNLKLIISVLIVAVVVAIGGVFLLWQSLEPQPTPSPSPPTPAAEVPNDWLPYQNEELGFNVKYPPNMKVVSEGDIPDSQDRYVTFSLLGPTQTGETEVFDGILLSMRTISYESSGNLREYVEAQIDREEGSGVARIINPLREITVNGIQGYAYQTDGLGIATIIYLPSEENSRNALSIGYIAPDPTGQGFEDIVEQIIESLQLI